MYDVGMLYTRFIMACGNEKLIAHTTLPLADFKDLMNLEVFSVPSTDGAIVVRANTVTLAWEWTGGCRPVDVYF